MERDGGDAGLVLELLGRDARRRDADHGDALVREDLRDGMGGGRLAGAREADDADDPAPARRNLAHHRLLLVRQHQAVGALDLGDTLLADRWCVGVTAPLDECQRRSLDRDQLGRRVAGRTAR